MKSEEPSISVGDHVTGMFRERCFTEYFIRRCADTKSKAFVEYAILPDLTKYIKVEKPGKEPWSVYVGVAGMPGRPRVTENMGYESLTILTRNS